MAKAIYVCSRTPLEEPDFAALHMVCDRLVPSHICPTLKIGGGPRSAFGIINPTESVRLEDGNLLLGHLFEDDSSRSQPMSGIPDGSYALFRRDDRHFEAVADPAASRTIWYFKDDERLIASTSQRAIICLLSSFEFDERVIPWMLSSGGLGPEYSWDRRLSRIPPDSSVVLDKRSWRLTLNTNRSRFRFTGGTEEEYRASMVSSLDEIMASLDVNFDTWRLPLSGGYDSRGLLCFLDRNRESLDNVRTLTWGVADALDDSRSDAVVARRVAEAYDVDHEYLAIDEGDVSFEKILERFLICGEGRVSQIRGYMDGLELWRGHFESGTEGVVRGDQGFGWFPATSPITARISVTGGLCKDFANLEDYRSYGLPPQRMPQYLQKREDESAATWRDRLYHQYHIPTILAGLADLKLCYVEQVTPWLSRQLLEEARRLPDHLRTNKALYAGIVESMGPDIPFATEDATPTRQDILSRPRVVELLQDELHSQQMRSMLPPGLIDDVSSGVRARITVEESPISRMVRSAKNLFPQAVKNRVRDYGMRPRIDENFLALRMLLISRMTSLLEDDVRKMSRTDLATDSAIEIDASPPDDDQLPDIDEPTPSPG